MMHRPPNGSQPPAPYGAQQSSPFGPQPQGQYGQAPQGQYGQAPQGQYGQQAPQAQYAPGYGPPQPQPPMPYGAPAYGATAHGGPVASVGLFGHIPCPHCGMATTSHAAGASAAQWAGGLVGWLLVSALSSKHYCVHHGEIAKAAFPPAHQSAMTTRMIVKLGAGGALLFLVVALMIVSAAFGN